MLQKKQLQYHPHCIIPSGGINDKGSWKSSKGKDDFLFCVKSLSLKFRGFFVSELRKQLPEIPQSIYDKLFAKKWVVYAKAPFGKPENVIEYLGRYTHKIAISNYRIVAIDKENKTVTFRLKEYKNQGKVSTLTLSTKEFIRRFQNHILPKGFTRIRHYGILSSSWKKEKLPRLQLQLMDKDQEYIETFVSEEKSLHRCCTHCKKGKLVTLLLFDSRGPPKNYKKIAARKILNNKI